MALLVVLVALALLGAVGAWLGVDSRPGANDVPEQRWPFQPRH